MTAELKVDDYDGDHYYEWDARKQYWDGWEWTKNLPDGQPTLNGNSSTHYPNFLSATEPRSGIYNSGAGSVGAYSCIIAPEPNEIVWYASKGAPRWDADRLWTTMGHLYKGGIWFKKKANISGFSRNKDPEGSKWSRYRPGFINTWSVSQTPPSPSEESQYFYLPAIGYYINGKLCDVGATGYYWTSRADEIADMIVYNLSFDNSGITMQSNDASLGYRVQAFE